MRRILDVTEGLTSHRPYATRSQCHTHLGALWTIKHTEMSLSHLLQNSTDPDKIKLYTECPKMFCKATHMFATIFSPLYCTLCCMSDQPRRAYYKFSEPKPWSAGRTSPSRDACGTVFRQLYKEQRYHYVPLSDNWRPICSKSDVLENRKKNTHHRPALLWRFSWFLRRI